MLVFLAAKEIWKEIVDNQHLLAVLISNSHLSIGDDSILLMCTICCGWKMFGNRVFKM